MRYAHDLVNVSLDKPIHAPEAVGQWEPYARKLAAQVGAVHQEQRRSCRFDAATFATNPGAVSRSMRGLAKARRTGDARGFVRELNELCTTQQLPLKQPDPAAVKITGKCSGVECSLTATAGGRTLEKEPRIRVPITAVTSEGIEAAVQSARDMLAEAVGVPPASKPAPPPSAKPAKKAKTGGVRLGTFAQLDGERIKLQLQVVPLRAVIASNDPLTFAINPDYPGWLQPRDRTRAANVAQVRAMAASLDPERLVEDYHTLDAGPPVVWETTDAAGRPNYMAVSGNGRVMAIQLAASQHPAQYAAYVAALERDWLVILDQPILVRVLNPEGRGVTQERAAEIAQLGNVARAIATSSVEQAAIDSGKMSAEFVARLQPMEDQSASLEQTIRAAKNRQWVVQFMRLVPSTEAADMTDDAGRVSESGIKRVVMALTMWTFGVEQGGAVAQLAFESIDQDARNIVQGTLRTVPGFAALRARLDGFVAHAGPPTMKRAVIVRDELLITPAIARAILAYVEIRRAGITVEDRLAQSRLGGFGAEPSLTEVELLKMYAQNSRSARAISTYLNAYVERAMGVPDPSQSSMLDDGGAERIEEGDALHILRMPPMTPTGQGEMLELSKRLTAAARRRLPRSAFACPDERAYPIHSAGHVRAAIGRYQMRDTLKCEGAEKRICKAAKKYKIHAEVCTI